MEFLLALPSAAFLPLGMKIFFFVSLGVAILALVLSSMAGTSINVAEYKMAEAQAALRTYHTDNAKLTVLFTEMAAVASGQQGPARDYLQNIESLNAQIRHWESVQIQNQNEKNMFDNIAKIAGFVLIVIASISLRNWSESAEPAIKTSQ
jgi:hypothetical protein